MTTDETHPEDRHEDALNDFLDALADTPALRIPVDVIAGPDAETDAETGTTGARWTTEVTLVATVTPHGGDPQTRDFTTTTAGDAGAYTPSIQLLWSVGSAVDAWADEMLAGVRSAAADHPADHPAEQAPAAVPGRTLSRWARLWMAVFNVPEPRPLPGPVLVRSGPAARQRSIQRRIDAEIGDGTTVHLAEVRLTVRSTAFTDEITLTGTTNSSVYDLVRRLTSSATDEMRTRLFRVKNH